jgi:hypothetical protein
MDPCFGTAYSTIMLAAATPWAVCTIDIESLQNRLLKVCYVPTTSARLPRLLFIYFFAAAIVLMK